MSREAQQLLPALANFVTLPAAASLTSTVYLRAEPNARLLRHFPMLSDFGRCATPLTKCSSTTLAFATQEHGRLPRPATVSSGESPQWTTAKLPSITSAQCQGAIRLFWQKRDRYQLCQVWVLANLLGSSSGKVRPDATSTLPSGGRQGG